MTTVITCADSNFFHFLPAQERNITRKSGASPVIYDLGLTQAQTKKLRSTVVQITPPEGFNENVPGGAIRTSHKPSCILDCMKRFEDDVLYVDADVVMMAHLPDACFDGADVALTPRHPNEMRSAAPFQNGTINAGVLFFRNTPAVHDLLVAWDARCAEGVESDQLALSHVLADAELTGDLGDATARGLNVRKLDARLFNDVGTTTGYLWHFKNAGRRFHKKRRWWKAILRERFAPARTARKIDEAQATLRQLPANKDHVNAKS